MDRDPEKLSARDYLNLLGEGLEEDYEDDEPVEGSSSSSLVVDSSLLAAHVLELDEKVAGALEVLADLVEKVGGGEGKKRARFYNWRHQSDVEVRRKLWWELREFVDWLNAEYFLQETHHAIPGCWYRHKEAVHVLTAIWAGWVPAYFSAKSFPTSEAAIWHRDTLYPLLERLENSFSQCRNEGRH